MKLASLEMTRLRIPFRFAFAHASAARRETEAVWVRAVTGDGLCGQGEGCPRSYVTGESLESAFGFFERIRASMLELAELSDLRAWVAEERSAIDANPAAWCAVELALLDALARSRRVSVESLLGLPEMEGTFRYTAVLGRMEGEAFRRTVALYRKLGMTRFKLKLSGRQEEDVDRMRSLRSTGEVESLRLDANNLWSSEREARRSLAALDGGFFAVEEPLPPNRYRELARLAGRLEVKIILDESFLREEQIEELDPETFILNLRISKLGGLLRSLAVLKAARRLGFRVVVGAQVGETSLLTRAALPLALEAGALLAGQEGAFGERLLTEDVCRPSLLFGREGLLRMSHRGPGFGIEFFPPNGSSLTSWSGGTRFLPHAGACEEV